MSYKQKNYLVKIMNTGHEFQISDISEHYAICSAMCKITGTPDWATEKIKNIKSYVTGDNCYYAQIKNLNSITGKVNTYVVKPISTRPLSNMSLSQAIEAGVGPYML